MIQKYISIWKKTKRSYLSANAAMLTTLLLWKRMTNGVLYSVMFIW